MWNQETGNLSVTSCQAKRDSDVGCGEVEEASVH